MYIHMHVYIYIYVYMYICIYIYIYIYTYVSAPPSLPDPPSTACSPPSPLGATKKAGYETYCLSCSSISLM